MIAITSVDVVLRLSRQVAVDSVAVADVITSPVLERQPPDDWYHPTEPTILAGAPYSPFQQVQPTDRLGLDTQNQKRGHQTISSLEDPQLTH